MSRAGETADQDGSGYQKRSGKARLRRSLPPQGAKKWTSRSAREGKAVLSKHFLLYEPGTYSALDVEDACRLSSAPRIRRVEPTPPRARSLLWSSLSNSRIIGISADLRQTSSAMAPSHPLAEGVSS